MIYFLGDVHGRIDHVLPALSARQDTAAHAIFLGDIDFRQPFEEEIRPLIDAGIQVWNPNSQAKDNSLPLLRSYDDYIDRQKSKTWPRKHESVKGTKNALKHLSTIFPDTYDQLAKQTADILVTHEAPSCHPDGFEVIDRLAQSMGVNMVFHGHHHDSLDYQRCEARLGFQAHGVGSHGITDMQGIRVRAGGLDEAHSYRQSLVDEKCP